MRPAASRDMVYVHVYGCASARRRVARPAFRRPRPLRGRGGGSMKSGGGVYEYSILCILPYSGCILDVSPCARRETIGYDQNTKRAVRIQTYSRP